MDLALLAHACAPYVAVQTTRAIVDVESGRDALAIHVNGARLQRPARSLGEAIATARALRAQGWNLDLGLAQINVRNLDRLGVPIEQAFDPCTNLRLMQRILQECFAQASRGAIGTRPVLWASLSCYNAGDPNSGLRNGYVARVLASATAARVDASAGRSLQRSFFQPAAGAHLAIPNEQIAVRPNPQEVKP
jgi:type IV secretion system protein VirB1